MYININMYIKLYIKEKHNRNRGKLKINIAHSFIYLLFEFVNNLMIEGFIASLKKFCIHKRGKAFHIYLNNATTFIGENCELKDLWKSENKLLS